MRKCKRNPVQSNIVLCLAYPTDLEQVYAFYCARYENISYKDFLHLPVSDFMKKLGSIPESEPLYKILQSRSIKLNEIKDKNERKYWSRMKQANAIPSEYLPIKRRKNDFKPMGQIQQFYNN